jgi:hypothetical protein
MCSGGSSPWVILGGGSSPLLFIISAGEATRVGWLIDGGAVRA